MLLLAPPGCRARLGGLALSRRCAAAKSPPVRGAIFDVGIGERVLAFMFFVGSTTVARIATLRWCSLG